MRQVRVMAKTDEPIEEIWEVIIDVKNWDKLIKFVKKIYLLDSVKVGGKFYDITTIFLLPAVIEHKITKIEKYKEFTMEAYLPFRTGKMFQSIAIKSKGNQKQIQLEIKFYISFFLFDIIFGSLLEKKLKEMVVETLKKIDNQIGSKNSEIITD
jgi:hypothetical protein